MASNETNTTISQKSAIGWLFVVLIIIGLVAFIYGILGDHPEKAWQAYLINFLLWSAIAQGAVLFSAVMHMTRARWSGPLSALSESFAAFFPLSFVLFLILFLGRNHIFPWLHEDLHGKEVWLNIPFLFTRDCIGLLVLYAIGFAYLYNALQLRSEENQARGKFGQIVSKGWLRNNRNSAQGKKKAKVTTNAAGESDGLKGKVKNGNKAESWTTLSADATAKGKGKGTNKERVGVDGYVEQWTGTIKDLGDNWASGSQYTYADFHGTKKGQGKVSINGSANAEGKTVAKATQTGTTGWSKAVTKGNSDAHLSKKGTVTASGNGDVTHVSNASKDWKNGSAWLVGYTKALLGVRDPVSI